MTSPTSHSNRRGFEILSRSISQGWDDQAPPCSSPTIEGTVQAPVGREVPKASTSVATGKHCCPCLPLFSVLEIQVIQVPK